VRVKLRAGSSKIGPAAEPPVIVILDDAAAFDAAVVDAGRSGWRITAGFHGPPIRSDEVRVGSVDSAADGAAALLAVLAGAGAIVLARAPIDVLDSLLDDLRHARHVEVRRTQAARPPSLDQDAVGILAILAQGRTLGDAAATLGLSRRTADRRLGEARRALGVTRTVEAVSRARRLGWLG
jgi:DNA-binding NarL/FixJ family response regulator